MEGPAARARASLEQTQPSWRFEAALVSGANSDRSAEEPRLGLAALLKHHVLQKLPSPLHCPPPASPSPSPTLGLPAIASPTHTVVGLYAAVLAPASNSSVYFLV